MALGIPIAAVAAMLVVAGCAATPLGRRMPGNPQLTQTIDAQIARDDAIVWTARRPLTWADFKGHPPEDDSVVAARTNYTIIDGVQCAGRKFEFRVVAAFRTKESWVRHAILRTPADSARAFRHEQTHFDLSEVHARRLRRYLAELMAPCNISSSDLSAAANRMERDEKAAQARYDERNRQRPQCRAAGALGQGSRFAAPCAREVRPVARKLLSGSSRQSHYVLPNTLAWQVRSPQTANPGLRGVRNARCRTQRMVFDTPRSAGNEGIEEQLRPDVESRLCGSCSGLCGSWSSVRRSAPGQRSTRARPAHCRFNTGRPQASSIGRFPIPTPSRAHEPRWRPSRRTSHASSTSALPNPVRGSFARPSRRSRAG